MAGHRYICGSLKTIVKLLISAELLPHELD